MDTPAVSIIVPVYNVVGYLDACVRSLMNQTYQDIEILMVDDGSTDGSGELCDDYAGTFDKISVIHEENSGPGYARNAGIVAAKGRYLLFVDSDDVLLPKAVERLVAIADTGKTDLVCYDLIVRKGKGESSRTVVIPAAFPTVKETSGIQCLRYIYEGRLGNYSMLFLYNREFLLQAGVKYPVNINVLEDAVFLNELLPKANVVRYCQAKMYVYNIRQNNSLGQGKNLEKAKGGYRAICRISENAKRLGLYQEFRLHGIDLLLFVYNLAGDGTDDETEKLLADIRTTLFSLSHGQMKIKPTLKREIQLLLIRYRLYDLLVHHLWRFG